MYICRHLQKRTYNILRLLQRRLVNIYMYIKMLKPYIYIFMRYIPSLFQRRLHDVQTLVKGAVCMHANTQGCTM